jgi:hypothetical protein
MKFKLIPVKYKIVKKKSLQPTAKTNRLSPRSKGKTVKEAYKVKTFCPIVLETVEEIDGEIVSVILRQSRFWLTAVVNLRDGITIVL